MPERVNSKDDGERVPLEDVKPPREWRSRTPKRPVHVTHQPPVSSAEPVAGSPLADASSTSLYTPQEPTPTPTPLEAAESVPELPNRYGQDRMVILVRDPEWVYVWWELTEAKLAAARNDLGETGSLILRFYDVSQLEWDGHNHHEAFDIEVNDMAGNWYVELDKPDGSFCAELGLRAADGRFLAIVRSNVVTLPRNSMSEVIDEEWMVVEDDYRRMFELSGGGSLGMGSGEIQRMLEDRLRQELASGNVSSFGISSSSARRGQS